MIRMMRLGLLAFFITSTVFAPALLGGNKSWADYNRKLTKLEEKRTARLLKLETDHQKYLLTQGEHDLADIQKREVKFRKKLLKVEEDYKKELLKLERKYNKRN